jgi:hypothetical protein
VCSGGNYGGTCGEIRKIRLGRLGNTVSVTLTERSGKRNNFSVKRGRLERNPNGDLA